MQRNCFQLKVTLKGVKPPVWRRILVYDDITMEECHDILQDVMGWTNLHLHSFKVGRKEYVSEFDTDSIEYGALSYADLQLKDILKEEKQKIQYLYDFGDDWQHEVLLEDILPCHPDMKLPECIAGKGLCPPEDCGGPDRYMEMLEVLKDPKHPEYKSYKDWLGDWGKEEFSVERINEWLHGSDDDGDEYLKDMVQKFASHSKSSSDLPFVEYRTVRRKYPKTLSVQHPAVLALKECNIHIDRNFVHWVLTLPREQLCRDLEQIILFAIGAYRREKKSSWGTEKRDPFEYVFHHTLFLLAELRGEECLPAVLEIMRQEPNFREYYFADTFTDVINQTLYYTGRNRLSDLSAFMKEPFLDTYSRIEVSSALRLIIWFEKDRRAEVMEWYREILSWYADNREVEGVVDAGVIGLMIADIMDVAGVELLPEIKRLFDLNLVDETVCGDFEEVEQVMPSGTSLIPKLMNIDELYDFYIKEWVSDGDWKIEESNLNTDMLFNEIKKQRSMLESMLNIQRNDLCPCGSGKKYKKCCGKN